jgi:hypothetical protein
LKFNNSVRLWITPAAVMVRLWQLSVSPEWANHA